MGFLRKKTIKGIDYYLWSERKRDGKKRGGTGKVKSNEFSLGRHHYRGEWIAAYAFLGYLPIKQFLENIAAWELKKAIRLWGLWGSCSIDPYSEEISFQVKYYGDSKPPTISMRSKGGIDLRKKKWKLARESINYSLEIAWEHCYEFDEEIEYAKKFLGYAKYFDSRADEVKKGISDPYDEEARNDYEELLNYANDDYLRVKDIINELLQRTPKRYRQEMRGKSERMIYR